MHVTRHDSWHAKSYIPCNLDSESSIEYMDMQGVIHKMFKTCDLLASLQTFLRPLYYLCDLLSGMAVRLIVLFKRSIIEVDRKILGFL